MTDGAPGPVLAPGACAPDDLAVEYDYFAGSKTGYPAAVPPLGAPSGEDSPGVTSATGWPPGPTVPAPPPPPNPPVGAGVPAQQAWPPGTTPIAIDEQMMLTSSAAKSYQNMTGKPGYYLPGSRLGFFGSIRVGFQLIPVCWSVLAQELMLLIVPLVVLLIGALALLGYAAAFGGVDGLIADDTAGAALRLFPIGVLLMVLSVVGQAIIVAAATEILNGKRSTFGAAWLAALNQLPRLAGFGVLYAGERLVTSLIRSRRGGVATALPANVIDRAWDFATFLAIPVLLYEDLSVFQAVRRSGQLVRQRWGVQLTARSVLGLALFVATLPLVGLAVLVAVGYSAVLGVVLILIVLLGQVAASGALTGVLSAALYRFGVTGLVAPGFNEADMWAAFDRPRMGF